MLAYTIVLLTTLVASGLLLVATVVLTLTCLRTHPQVNNRSAVLLLFSNVGAATFFSVAGLVFGGVWELTVSVDVLGDVGQCLFLWGVMLRCYRLYRVFEIRRRPAAAAVQHSARSRTARTARSMTSRSVRSAVTYGTVESSDDECPRGSSGGGGGGGGGDAITSSSSVSSESEEQMPSGSKLSLGYFLKIYVAAFLLCLIYNTIWDLVYTVTGDRDLAVLIQVIFYAVSGVFYACGFIACIWLLRNVDKYFSQTKELILLSVVCILTRLAVVWDSYVSSHENSLVPALLECFCAVAVLWTSGLYPLWLTMCTRDSVVLAGGDDVFQPLTSGNYERSLYAARMRSHDVDRVATFKRVDSSPSAASRSARRKYRGSSSGSA